MVHDAFDISRVRVSQCKADRPLTHSSCCLCGSVGRRPFQLRSSAFETRGVVTESEPAASEENPWVLAHLKRMPSVLEGQRERMCCAGRGGEQKVR